MLKLDQSWAGHAVVYSYWDMIMNQWLIVFYYQTFPILKIPFQKSPTTPPLTLITYPIPLIGNGNELLLS